MLLIHYSKKNLNNKLICEINLKKLDFNLFHQYFSYVSNQDFVAYFQVIFFANEY
jgi:hypothetical protein